MRIAFKEWAIVVDALGAGEQILIFRKGGIREGRRGFQVEHSDFLLYPTWQHQQQDLVLPAWQARYAELISNPLPAAEVRLDYLAQVVSWRRLEAIDVVQRLRGQHILRDEVVAQRFEWGKDKNIFVLAVRVFRIEPPVLVPVLPGYAGCKSWVDLEQDLQVNDATPVLSKEAFNAKLNQFHGALDWDGSKSLNAPTP